MGPYHLNLSLALHSWTPLHGSAQETFHFDSGFTWILVHFHLILNWLSFHFLMKNSMPSSFITNILGKLFVFEQVEWNSNGILLKQQTALQIFSLLPYLWYIYIGLHLLYSIISMFIKQVKQITDKRHNSEKHSTGKHSIEECNAKQHSIMHCNAITSLPNPKDIQLMTKQLSIACLMLSLLMNHCLGLALKRLFAQARPTGKFKPKITWFHAWFHLLLLVLIHFHL